MSAFGYSRMCRRAKPTSGFPPKADLKSAMSVFGSLTTAFAQEADIAAPEADVRK